MIFQEWLDNQDANPDIAALRQGLIDGFDEEDEVEVEDLTAVKWQAPSDLSSEEVMGDIEAFNRAMADSHVTLDDGDGGWV